ncbi:MAG: transcription antitermination factor NusB [Lysobacterales bacterium]|jgi:transcription antitermination factor NusB
MRKRTLAREFVLKIFYQAEMTRRELHTASEVFWSEKEKIEQNVKEFSDMLVLGVEKNKKEVDDIIRKYAANWQLERMAVIDRNILRLGTFEIMFADEIPPKVTINEAVELAKKYGDSESGKFVNGILDKIHKEELLPKDK